MRSRGDVGKNFQVSDCGLRLQAKQALFVYMNAITFKCIFSLYDQKSVSRLFMVILRHSVVEYSFRA